MHTRMYHRSHFFYPFSSLQVLLQDRTCCCARAARTGTGTDRRHCTYPGAAQARRTNTSRLPRCSGPSPRASCSSSRLPSRPDSARWCTGSLPLRPPPASATAAAAAAAAAAGAAHVTAAAPTLHPLLPHASVCRCRELAIAELCATGPATTPSPCAGPVADPAAATADTRLAAASALELLCAAAQPVGAGYCTLAALTPPLAHKP
jgi:hypothetical protein